MVSYCVDVTMFLEGIQRGILWHTTLRSKVYVHAYMVKSLPDSEQRERSRQTGRKHIPTRLFKQAVSLSKQATAIEKTLDGINVMNAGK